ncbi:helix-turn-helix domain-containing protein [uncultured Polaribacter sp.]|uniref:helix-turn-helix domain-containing protein n=1 Tax=uncultured Polaribacter sp. TaxID=174711 RepID=UPI00259B0B8C|nr:helix-turn-helix domain-containing protein [uncultured Polaribacter sp.]
MAVKEFFNLFLVISALHGFLFSAILFLSKKGRVKSIIFINLLVVSISLNNFQSWILAKDFFNEYFFLDYIHIPWHFLVAPFFYMFLIHYLEIEKRSKNILNLVLPVFIVIILIRIGFVYFYSNNKTNDIVFLFEKYTSIEEIISLVFSLSIFYYSFYILNKKENLFKRILTYDDLKWINTFFKLGAFTYLFWITALIITVSLNFKEFIYSYYPLRVLTTVLIYWVGYQSVLQLRVLNERKYLRKQMNSKISIEIQDNLNEDNLNEDNLNEDNLTISKDIIDSVLVGLELFEKKQEYLSKKITLNLLARKLNTNANYLSKIINHYKKKSFPNYLNTLRINNIVKQLKKDQIIRKFTIKAIAQEAGFNNSDSFSKVFFKMKGVKPSDFIRNLK